MSGLNSISGSAAPAPRIEQTDTLQSTATNVGDPSQAPVKTPDVPAVPSSPSSLASLGLSHPVNAEDFEVLLMDIEMKLDKAMQDSRNARVISLAQGIRAALAGLISRSNAMAAMGQQMCDSQARIDDNTARLNSYQQEQLQANIESSKLGPRIDAARAKLADLSAVVRGLDSKSPHYGDAARARDAAQALLSDLEARKADADARADRSGHNFTSTQAQIAADRTSLVALASQYSGLQLLFMSAFGELTRLFAGHSGSKQQDDLTDHLSELRVDDLNDLVKAFGEHRVALDEKNTVLRQDRVRDSERDRVEGSVALVVSAIAEVLTALAEIAPEARSEDETGAEMSHSMMFRG